MILTTTAKFYAYLGARPGSRVVACLVKEHAFAAEHENLVSLQELETNREAVRAGPVAVPGPAIRRDHVTCAGQDNVFAGVAPLFEFLSWLLLPAP
jgi:hypothetical protein